MDEDNDENQGLFEEDYYSFLNVPRDAPTEAITNAYRRMSRAYHPDKHVDPELKKDAEIIFNKTKKAYEVLKDPHRRAVYDSVGNKGLEASGWELIQKTKTPAEIREEYENLARQREERRLQQRTNPRGTVVTNINATDLFNQYEYDLDDGVPNIEISGMTVTQSIDAPITPKDTLTFMGQLNTHNGTGSGTLTVSNKRLISDKTWIEGAVGAGAGPIVNLKGFHLLSKTTFVQVDTYIQSRPSSLRSGLDGTIGTQFGKDTMGYITWRTGSSSSMSTSLSKDTENTNTSITLLLGVPHSHLSLNFTYKFIESQSKLRLSAKLGTFGALLEYGAEKKISEQSLVSASVSVGTPTGVILRLKYTRGTQNYLFPVHLCDEVIPSPIFYATVTPLLVWIVAKKLIIDPIVNEQTATKRQKQKDNYRNRLAEKRREAQAAINLMSVTFSRIRSEEENRRGLVIVSADYGHLTNATNAAPTTTENRSDEIIDVTIPLQCLVSDSKLVIHETTKSQLPGIYDPCPGEDKFLCVQYLFHNHLHQTTVADTEPLRIPRQSHRVNLT